MVDQTPIIQLKGIGEKTAKLFQKLSLNTAFDLLHYYPRDYEVFEGPVSISELCPDELQAFQASIQDRMAVKKVRNLTLLHCYVSDPSGRISLTWFNMPYLRNSIKKGQPYIFRGIPRLKKGSLTVEQAQIYEPNAYLDKLGLMQPKYSLTAGMTNNMISKAVKAVLSSYKWEADALPDELIKELSLLPYQQAMMEIHYPPNKEQMLEARKRLVFDEFLLFLLSIRKCKERQEIIKNNFPMQDHGEAEQLLSRLPYDLTGAQHRVWKEIQSDLMGERVMNRLVQGDVGSGKTILAFLALLLCVNNGYQGALMAPTEVLAKQHFSALVSMAEEYGLSVHPLLLTGSMTAREKREAYAQIAEGSADVIIGTHALIQEKVIYKNLALVVTDEQHRFGVRQRETFAGKGDQVHVMVMSATPIPRTLAIILYGDLDLSVVDELPAARLPIKNCVVGTDYREKAYQFITKEVQAGRQVYVICPMVEEGELEGVENVLSYTEKLKNTLTPEIRVAYLHGKMKPAEKNRVMEDYGTHQIDVLVSTTVIEVGINVPNATVMMVENAERFGLSQLHQLRGRVGRGAHQSYCIFISGSDQKTTMERLEILNHSNDGFLIAEEDLRLRGPGDLFGIRQSGVMEFRLGDIYQDASLLMLAGKKAEEILSKDPELSSEKYHLLKKRLDQALNVVDFRTI